MRPETMRDIRDILRTYGYRVLMFKDVPESRSKFAFIFNNHSVYEFYISFGNCYASIQMIDSVMIHEVRDVSGWFF